MLLSIQFELYQGSSLSAALGHRWQTRSPLWIKNLSLGQPDPGEKMKEA